MVRLEFANALTCTGELTVEPLTGLQIVIEGALLAGEHAAFAEDGAKQLAKTRKRASLALLSERIEQGTINPSD